MVYVMRPGGRCRDRGPGERAKPKVTQRTKQKIRFQYTAAVQRSHGAGERAWKKRASLIKLGYSANDLALVPAAAIGHTFACGNPLAFADVRGGDTVVDLGSGAGLDCILMASRLDVQNRILGFDMMWGVRPLIGLMARLGCHHVLRPAANRLVRGFSSIHLTAVKPCQSAHGYPWTSVGVLRSRERRA